MSFLIIKYGLCMFVFCLFTTVFNMTSFCREVGPLSYSRMKVLRLDGNNISYQQLPSDWVFCLRVLESIYLWLQPSEHASKLGFLSVTGCVDCMWLILKSRLVPFWSQRTQRKLETRRFEFIMFFQYVDTLRSTEEKTDLQKMLDLAHWSSVAMLKLAVLAGNDKHVYIANSLSFP